MKILLHKFKLFKPSESIKIEYIKREYAFNYYDFIKKKLLLYKKDNNFNEIKKEISFLYDLKNIFNTPIVNSKSSTQERALRPTNKNMTPPTLEIRVNTLIFGT